MGCGGRAKGKDTREYGRWGGEVGSCRVLYKLYHARRMQTGHRYKRRKLRAKGEKTK